jgi:hypothetical protein
MVTRIEYFHWSAPAARDGLNLPPHGLPGLSKSYWYFGIDISIKKPPKPGEGAVEKNQLKKSPLRRLARSS